MLRMTSRDPLYAEWNELLTLYAAMLNPQCHYNTREVDTESAEYEAAVTEWREHVAEMFNELTR